LNIILLVAAYWLLSYWLNVKEYAIMRDDPKISLQVVYSKLFISGLFLVIIKTHTLIFMTDSLLFTVVPIMNEEFAIL